MDLVTRIAVLDQHYEDIARKVVDCGNCDPTELQMALLDALEMMREKLEREEIC